MTEAQNWAQRAAARMVRAPGEVTEERDDSRPAWSRIVVDRVMGRDPDPEDLAAVQRERRRPRTEFERKLLERLGYDETPPPAA